MVREVLATPKSATNGCRLNPPLLGLSSGVIWQLPEHAQRPKYRNLLGQCPSVAICFLDLWKCPGPEPGPGPGIGV